MWRSKNSIRWLVRPSRRQHVRYYCDSTLLAVEVTTGRRHEGGRCMCKWLASATNRATTSPEPNRNKAVRMGRGGRPRVVGWRDQRAGLKREIDFAWCCAQALKLVGKCDGR